jgi:hypothetical protein
MSTGQIHDLGYKRYVGSRRSVGTRWRVIMRHQIATAWRGWWRFKMWLIAALITTASIGAVLYFMHDRVLKVLGGVGGQAVVKFADGLVPFSTVFYCKVGFAVSLTVSATLVAGDLQSGAFTFYFARSARPVDYILGKLAGLAVLLAVIMAVGPLLLAGVRLGLAEDLDQLITLLPMLGKELAVGVVGTLIYAVVPLGFSALTDNKRHALALWAAYYVVVGSMAGGIAYATTPAVAAIDLSACLHAISLHLYDQRFGGARSPDIPTVAALISVFGHVAAAIAVVFWRVRRAQQTGVGGAS